MPKLVPPALCDSDFLRRLIPLRPLSSLLKDRSFGLERPSSQFPQLQKEGSELRRIIYISDCCVDNLNANLIALESQSRNAHLGVTGVLFISAGRFYQLLEGKKETVTDLLNVIKKDPRHSAMRVVSDAAIKDRQFPNWSMRSLEDMPDVLGAIAEILDESGGERLGVAIELLQLCVRRPPSVCVNPNTILKQSHATYESVPLLSGVNTGDVSQALIAENIYLKALLKQSESARRSFFSAISHELRTPLWGILAANSLLLNPKTDAKARTRHSSALSLSAKKLQGTLDTIIEISRLQSGDVMLDLQQANLSELCEEVLSEHQPELDLRGNQLVLNLNPHDDYGCLADWSRLKHTIAALIDNANQHTDRGIITLVLTKISAWPGFSWWRCSISDSGCGISVEKQATLFQAFSQSTSPEKTGYSTGAGLGLALVRMTAEKMGGKVGMSSQVGSGSTFWFTFLTAAA